MSFRGSQYPTENMLDDAAIDTTSRTGKLVMGILALIAEFENDIRRERPMDGIKKAHEPGFSHWRKRTSRPIRSRRCAERRCPRQRSRGYGHASCAPFATASSPSRAGRATCRRGTQELRDALEELANA